ncbi:MAG: D-alanyl-D-alanine carboxypeptidase [Ruminococcus sp.]|nr:D-alanyl-D-alanine carboxypeptidase [Ruminococcus sp.]
MKKIVVSICAVMLFPAFSAMDVKAVNEPEISAKGAVLISADTGEIIYSVNCDEKLPMASTTKIMTTLLCLESGNLYEEFEVDGDAIMVEGSSMGLQKGDIVTKYALCCGMLLPSGNDAANATAVKLAGSLEDFAVMMNDKAKELGLSRTWFVTPSGLEGVGHGSSAYDMAILAREALKNETFREICSSPTIKTEFGNTPYTRWLKNTNKLLTMYDGVYGVKTGFTDEAGRCLVSACERDGINLICVTLNDRNDWNDHMAMYDYGFENAHNIQLDIPENLSMNIAGAETDSLSLTAEPVEITVFEADKSDFEYKVISAPFVYAPVSKGDETAQLSISYNDREIRRIPLYADSDASVKMIKKTPEKKGFFRKLTEKFTKKENLIGKNKNTKNDCGQRLLFTP